MGALTDESAVMGSVLGRSRAIFDSVHIHLGMVVADKTNLTVNETLIKAELEKKYKLFIIDDDDVDAGNFDLGICELVIVSTSVTDMTKINNLTTLAVPIFTRNAEAALTILRIGDDSGGSGVSWGENPTETAINIVDNTHEITTDLPLGSLTVFSPAGRMQWIRATDKVAGAHELAEIDGDNTKSTIIVLPYDVADEDGNPTPALRVFIGLREFGNFTSDARNIMFNALDWAIHQWLFSVKVQGLSRINTIINMLGRNDFTTAKNLYDYLVHGTDGSAPFEVISEQEIGSVMERLEWIKNAVRRGTGTILPANKSLYDVIALDRLDSATYGLSALKTLIDAIEGKLDVPANFMADVSALALEASLGTHDTDIKTFIAALNDISDADVWNYVTRTLTAHAFPFTNPASALDVSNIRTAAYGQYNTEMARITANVATEAKQDIIDGIVDDILADTATINWGDITAIDGLIDGIIADIGVFPTANYATFAAYVEDIRTRLIAIVGDTNELQTDWANGGRLDLLIDAIKLKTDNIPATPATEAKQDTIIGYIDTEVGAIETKLDSPANFRADVSALALETTLGTHDTDIKALLNHATYGLSALNTDLDKLLTAIIQGTGTVLPSNKSLYDLLWLDKSDDELGSFNWDTSAFTTVEQDVSALFTTALTGTKRRSYHVYLALHNVEGDANFDECYIRVYVKINGTYQCIDKATKTKANLQAEPGVPIEIPKTAEDAKITLQMKTALAVDKTIDYSYVQEKMEY